MRHAAALIGLAVTALAAGAASAESLWVEYNVSDPQPARIRALYERPAGAGPFPAVIMLHGCSGGFVRGNEPTVLYRWWKDFALARGFAVLLPDSLVPRGLGSICAVAENERTITPHVERRADALAAGAWLAARPEIRKDAILLMGWSHGAMTALAALDELSAGPARPFREALLFYPGCGRYRRVGFAPVVPTAILIGAADDWTRADFCREAVEKGRPRGGGVRLEIYPGAYHSFDHPNLPLRTRMAGGGRTVHIGTDPAARALAIAEAEAFLSRYRR